MSKIENNGSSFICKNSIYKGLNRLANKRYKQIKIIRGDICIYTDL